MVEGSETVTSIAEFVEVSKTFVTATGQVQALAPISLRLQSDQFTTLIGPSGCGKSTLLHIAAGLTEATSGDIFIDGHRVTGPGPDRGMVFQSYTLFPWLSARENIEFALREMGYPRKDRRAIALENLRLVGLEAFADAKPSELSGGMRQRVAIARVLSYKPKMLLMDEPFGALDAQTRTEMHELLTDVWESHKLTVLFVTHDIEEAIFLSDRIIVMSPHPGRIKEDIDVTIPRPRDQRVLASEEHHEYKARLLELIRGRE